jgi:hypothetical protein
VPLLRRPTYLTSLEVLELLTGVAKIVKEKEPGTLKYHLLKETRGGSPRVIVSET